MPTSPTISQLEARVAELDAEILKAVTQFAEEARHISTLGGFGQKLVALVAAKRSAPEGARRPRLLSAEEAMNIAQRSGGLEVVLREAHSRALAVIETLPCWGYDHNAKSLAVVDMGSELRSMIDIRKALLQGGGE